MTWTHCHRRIKQGKRPRHRTAREMRLGGSGENENQMWWAAENFRYSPDVWVPKYVRNWTESQWDGVGTCHILFGTTVDQLIFDLWPFVQFFRSSSSRCVLVDKWVSLRNRTQTSPNFLWVLRCVPSISWARNQFLWIWPWGIPHFWTHVPETWPNPKGGHLRIVFVRSHDGSLAKELSNWADASLQCWLLTEIAENRLERNQANPSGSVRYLVVRKRLDSFIRKFPEP